MIYRLLLDILRALQCDRKGHKLILERLGVIEDDIKVLQMGQGNVGARLDKIQTDLDAIKDALIPGQAVSIVFTATLDGQTTQGVNFMNMRDDQQVTLSIVILDKKGKPAPVDGNPVWASSDETVVTVEPTEDGMGAVVKGVAPGSARVVVTADAIIGEGTQDVTGILEFDITPGQAVSVTINASAPTDQE